MKDILLLFSLPIAALTIANIQIAELFLPFVFFYLVLILRRLNPIILSFLLIGYSIVISSFGFSGLSQSIKFLIIYLIFSCQMQKRDMGLSRVSKKFLTGGLVLLMLSGPLDLRFSNSFYVDAHTGIFRHSVDYAFAIILSIWFWKKVIGKNSFSYALLGIFVSMGSFSRVAIMLIPSYVMFKRPAALITMGCFTILLVKLNLYGIIEQYLDVPQKLSAFIAQVIESGVVRTVLNDSSILIRVENFSALFENMSYKEIIFGVSREKVLMITSNLSNGDVATDNIFLYKMIFFGVPLGFALAVSVIYFIYILVNRDVALTFLFIVFGMLQDWLSNGFAIYSLFVFSNLGLKWSQKTGQLAKVCPKPMKG